MSKELEALDVIVFHRFDDLFDDEEYDKNVNIVEEGLERLEAIDNSNPSEALESIEEFIEDNKKSIEVSKANNFKTILTHLEIKKRKLITIKQALIKAQEDKIIADFIREHYKLSNDINKNYLELKKPITVEEHNKFKRGFTI